MTRRTRRTVTGLLEGFFKKPFVSGFHRDRLIGSTLSSGLTLSSCFSGRSRSESV